MEPAGLAVGVTGLIGIFSTCLDIVERWDSYKDFGVESGSLIARFRADRVRFQQWGQRVGIDKGKHGDGYHKALDDPLIRPVVDQILQSIKHFDDDTGDFTSCLRPISGLIDPLAHSKSVLPRERPQFEKYQDATSRKSRLGWALRWKTRSLAFVESFDALVQKLYDLVPPDQPTIPGQMISEPRHSNLASLNDIVTKTGETSWHLDIQRILADVEKQLDNETRKELNDWLDTHDTKQMYDDFVRRILDGTCDWILNRPEFLKWQSFPSENAKLLWVNGPPGYGKTILCARIVQHLLATSNSPLAYFFFSSELESRADPFVVMKSWISQITIQNRDAFDLAREKREATDGRIASQTDIEELFKSIVQNIPRCIFIVDGLDECTVRENDGKTGRRDSLLKFLKSLKYIISNSKSRLLVVSRNDQEIREGLNGNKTNMECELVELPILPRDVESDATLFSQSIIEEKLANKSEAQRQELAHRMVDRCDSMFLGIKLLEPDLKGGKNLKQLQRLIDEAPNKLDRIYDRNWERIRNLENISRQRAFSILRWATFALRPITICEITEALLLAGDECGTLDYTELPDSIDEVYIKTEISELCGSLIEVRRAESASSLGYSTIHLSHFSVRQYILCHMPARPGELIGNEQLRSSNEAIQSNILAKICIRYLDCKDVWEEIQQQEGNNSIIQAFREYAANLWHKHVKHGIVNSEDVVQLINTFFHPENENWESWRKYSENGFQNKMIQYEGELLSGNPLFYASLLGFSKTLTHLIEEVGLDVNCVDSSNRTALLGASSKGWVSGVIQLLQRGASPWQTRTDGHH
ncbi:prion-inhibition and propagation-domain-containing protein [Xylaria bambusicola]|uniref:prion-inhibition and propagation-domain-containing protein n=1 Tax=Xylaria bambusicola TaxID=326684 RepID=UPI002008D97A|nr:prion-inhibition and propagation-domain-containing protein [Xylaria bambusicola]KAI0509464.1 prion-inhibition and propagation-domain-containing protein [Xylaria bambusicola]